MKILYRATLLAVALSLGACQSEEQFSNRGFSLPEGDANAGQASFVEIGCVQCHSVAGTDLSGDDWAVEIDQEISVELGGQTTRVKTYADLVTSIINPSHRIAKGYPIEKLVDVTLDGDIESKMYNYNEVMQVSELIDIVTFLKEKYQLTLPPSEYPRYGHY